jgi:SAM-dependent methyltransferase
MYDSEIHQSRSKVKRFSHGRRFEFALETMLAGSPNRFLDYGTGNGHMLAMIQQVRPDAEIWGFEPVKGMRDELADRFRSAGIETVHVVDDESSLQGVFDRICCLEVLEHLPPRILEGALRRMGDLLAPDGTILISVPLETGLTAVAKNLHRIWKMEPHPDTTVLNVLRCSLGIPISRTGDDGYILGHLGFSYRELEKTFSRVGLSVRKRFFSPFPALGPVLNSQVFYRLSKG